MTKRVIKFGAVIGMLMFFSGQSVAQNKVGQVSDLDALGIGQTLTLKPVLCNAQAGDDDWNLTSKLVIPSGFEVLKAEVFYNSCDECSIRILDQTQPGYIDLSRNSSFDISAVINDYADSFKDDETDTSSVAKLKLLGASLSFGSVLDATTHAEIKYKCHAEGHKWEGDGHIRAGVAYTVIKAPSNRDYQKVLLSLATLVEPLNQEALDSVITLMTPLVTYGDTKDKAQEELE